MQYSSTPGSHLEVTATALGGKSTQTMPITCVTISLLVTAAPDCLDSVLPCPPGILALPQAQSSPLHTQPQSQVNAVTSSLKGMGTFSKDPNHTLLHSVQSQDMSSTPTSPYRPRTRETGSSHAGVKSSQPNTLSSKMPMFSKESHRPFIGEEQERSLQVAPLLMLKQGSTCAALGDSQLSHLPPSEQLLLASHPHTLLNT